MTVIEPDKGVVGDERVRTSDLLRVREALYQLS